MDLAANVFIVRSGPKKAYIVKAESLGALDFQIIKDTITGNERCEKGPKQVFMGASEKVVQNGEGIRCNHVEYVCAENTVSGAVVIHKGPCIWFPNAYEKGTKGDAIVCNDTEFVRVTNAQTGKMTIHRGPVVWFPEQYEVGKKETIIALKTMEYMFVSDSCTGTRHVVKGACAWFPEPYETAGKVKLAWSLKANEYARLVDSTSGDIRVVYGPQTVFPNPTEKLLDGKVLEAIKLKQFEYADILDDSTGEIRQLSGPAHIYLGPHERLKHNLNVMEKPHCNCGSAHVLCVSKASEPVARSPDHVLSPRGATIGRRDRNDFSNLDTVNGIVSPLNLPERAL